MCTFSYRSIYYIEQYTTISSVSLLKVADAVSQLDVLVDEFLYNTVSEVSDPSEVIMEQITSVES